MVPVLVLFWLLFLEINLNKTEIDPVNADKTQWKNVSIPSACLISKTES